MVGPSFVSRVLAVALATSVASACSGAPVRSDSSTLSPPATPTAPPASPSASSRPAPPSLVGDTRNAWAFAPVAHPERLTVEGSVPSQRAWSTSKVLVVAAFLDTVVHGDPGRLTAPQRSEITTALSESDAAAVAALGSAIPGGQTAAMTAVLRSIGDRTTTVPDRLVGTMTWALGEQVRFMAALAAGRVVSPAASAYLLDAMRPIPAHSWGLGRVGATAYKGGWLRADTETRQMGIVDGYAVSVITYAVGPALPQTDGDSAHVAQLDRLAELLAARLTAERSAG